MKIYIAGPEPHDLKVCKTILLSYYDIYVSNLPFRKKTYKLIKSNKNENLSRRRNVCNIDKK